MPSAELELFTPQWNDKENATHSESLPMSWYPVCKTNELKKGQVKLVELFERQWIVFRTRSDKVVVQSRYCCHMGVDLLCGKVIGENLLCPMHRWEFNSDGLCVKIPSEEPIPKAAKQDTLPCVERYGVVFVFWGKEILFDIPNFPGLIEPMVDKAYFRVAPTPVTSIMLNAFDIHHLKYVHGREVIEKPHISSSHSCHLAIDMTTRVLLNHWNDYITRALGFKTAHIRFDCWSGNLIMVTNHSAKFRVLLALSPLNNDSCKVYFIGAMDQHRLNFFERLLKRWRLRATSFLGKEFLKLDIPFFTGMQPKPGTLLKDADAYAVKFWQHWQRLPRKKIPAEKRSLP